MAELAPGPVYATREDAIAAEVDAVEAELVRVDSRLRSLAWDAGPICLRPAETWEIALGVAPDHQATDAAHRRNTRAARPGSCAAPRARPAIASSVNQTVKLPR